MYFGNSMPPEAAIYDISSTCPGARKYSTLNLISSLTQCFRPSGGFFDQQEALREATSIYNKFKPLLADNFVSGQWLSSVTYTKPPLTCSLTRIVPSPSFGHFFSLRLPSGARATGVRQEQQLHNTRSRMFSSIYNMMTDTFWLLPCSLPLAWCLSRFTEVFLQPLPLFRRPWLFSLITLCQKIRSKSKVAVCNRAIGIIIIIVIIINTFVRVVSNFGLLLSSGQR